MRKPDVNGQFNITGRGLVLTVTDNEVYSIGDIIEYQDKKYRISGVECWRDLFTGALRPNKGLIVIEI